MFFIILIYIQSLIFFHWLLKSLFLHLYHILLFILISFFFSFILNGLLQIISCLCNLILLYIITCDNIGVLKFLAIFVPYFSLPRHFILMSPLSSYCLSFHFLFLYPCYAPKFSIISYKCKSTFLFIFLFIKPFVICLVVYGQHIILPCFTHFP